MELIPAIDLKDGRCVRLFKGDFAAETVYSNEPAEILARYRAFGARRIHVVDLDGAKDGTQANRDVIVKFAQRQIIEAAGRRRLALAASASRRCWMPAWNAPSSAASRSTRPMKS